MADDIKETADQRETRLARITYHLTHKEHGNAICDGRQIDAMRALGWEAEGDRKEPEGLAALVDDRALPALKELGIETVEQFLAFDREKLTAVKYITAKVIAKVEEAAKA